jgi:hypothetical protein
MLLDATASIFRIDVILRAWQLIAARIAWWRLSHIDRPRRGHGDTRRENFARIDC